MPASKPSALVVRHETAAEKRARGEREAALRPDRGLPLDPPTRMCGHPVAEKTWRRLVRLLNSLEGEIATRLDVDMLIDYCILVEQVGELDQMRKASYQTWLAAGVAADRAKTRAEKAQAEAEREAKSAQAAGEDIPVGLFDQVTRLEEKAVELASQAVNAFEAVVKLDSRVDRKRALLLQLRQSLYLTPRARAGTAPAEKEKPEEPDELEQLLNEANDVIGNGKS